MVTATVRPLRVTGQDLPWQRARLASGVSDCQDRHLFGAKISPDVFGTNASFSTASWWGWPFAAFTADEIVLVKAFRFHVPGAAPFFLGVEVTMAAGCCADRRDRGGPDVSTSIHASHAPRQRPLTASSQFKLGSAQVCNRWI